VLVCFTILRFRLSEALKPGFVSMGEESEQLRTWHKVKYRRASATEVMERGALGIAGGRPEFDVTFAIKGAQAILKQAGVFTKFTPPWPEKFPPAFKDQEGLVTAWRHTPIGMLYNTELVPAADAPKNLDDLLHPKWR
jgi:ABC-type Fe3+ transport system substrate-binding protein